MKLKKYKYNFLATALLVSGALFGSCSNSDIVTTPMDEGKFETSDVPVAYTVNKVGKPKNTTIEFREEMTSEVFLHLTQESGVSIEAEFFYNPSVLQKYNEFNGTKYKAFPENNFKLEGEGKVSISTGDIESSGAKFTLTTNKDLNYTDTYVVPLSAKTTSKEVKVSQGADYLIFVKDLTKIPNAAKETGIQIISCMEVNDTNPLNNLSFTLKESGKPLIDIVILFSGNINYNPETGRVFNHNNPNVQHLLDNREKYLKPLQDRGMKVVLGILGNHDMAGVSSLTDETAREFAQELKAVCDAYQLDGIFYDDEYSKPWDGVTPGFTFGNHSRLVYETKQAMPDKHVSVYAYGSTSRLSTVDGVQPGDYIDWGIHDYGNSWDMSGSYPGLPRSGMAISSQEFAQGRTASEGALRNIRNNGYGGNMIFAMDPFRSNFNYSQMPAMERMAKILFDDELVFDGKKYQKDW